MSATNDDSGTRAPHHGGCHCGALRWTFASDKPLSALAPRACDCDFCERHGAAWVSDAQVSLQIRARAGRLQRYRQGSGQAEFLLCRDCGVLVAVIASTAAGHLIGAANRNAFDARAELADARIVSPRLLPAESKLPRWGELWSSVLLEEGCSD